MNTAGIPSAWTTCGSLWKPIIFSKQNSHKHVVTSFQHTTTKFTVLFLCVQLSVSTTKTHQFLSLSLSHTHTPPQTHKKPFSLQNLGCLSSGHEMDKYWLLIKIRWWGLHGEANSTRRHHKNNNPNVFLVIKLDTQHGKKWLKVSICIPRSQYLRSTSSPVSHLPTLVPIKRA